MGLIDHRNRKELKGKGGTPRNSAVATLWRPDWFVSRVLPVALLGLILLLGQAGCSQKGPGPDDDDDGEGSAQAMLECGASGTERFQICAEGILTSFELSPDERRSLASCADILTAAPIESPDDAFEAARAAVLSTCRASH